MPICLPYGIYHIISILSIIILYHIDATSCFRCAVSAYVAFIGPCAGGQRRVHDSMKGPTNWFGDGIPNTLEYFMTKYFYNNSILVSNFTDAFPELAKLAGMVT